MIHLLPENQYKKVTPLFNQIDYNLTIQAVIEQTTPGVVYVDNISNPQTALIWDKSNSFYLAGYEDNALFNDAVTDLIAGNISAEAKTNPDLLDFVFHYSSDAWEEKIKMILKNNYPIKDNREYYTFKKSGIDWKNKIPSGYEIKQVDEHFLKSNSLRNLDKVSESIHSTWNTTTEFLQKGFGFCLVNNNNNVIASWCIVDYVCGKTCEIGIATDKDYRRKGFGTLTVAATLEYCTARNFELIGWHCWTRNIASVGVARKAGFEKATDYPVYYFWINKLDNFLINGNHYFSRSFYEEAAHYYEKAFQLMEVNGEDALSSKLTASITDKNKIYFLTGCAWDLAGNNKKAMEKINKALDNGFDISSISNDQAFENYRKTTHWERLKNNATI